MANDIIQVKANSLKSLLQSAKKEIEAALPRHVTPDRMMRIALTEARKTPKLLECDPASFLGAVIQASQLGLEPGGALGHCYLIPYGKEVQFQLGYRGMLNLAMRSDRVSHIISRAVFKDDDFKFSYGLEESIHHIPTRETQNEDDMTHCYAVVFLKDGGRLFDVMSRAEIDKIKNNSKAGNNGPWKTHYPEMARKTVIRRLFKYSPCSIEMERGTGLDEMADAGESQGLADILETTARHIEPKQNSLSNTLKSLNGDDKVVQDKEDPNNFDNFNGDPRNVK